MTAQHYDFENSAVTVDASTQTAYFASSYNLSGPNGIYFVSTRTFDVLGMLPGEDFGLYQSGGDHIIHYGSDGIAFRSSTASLLGTGKGSVDDGIYLVHTSLAKGN